MPDLRPIAFILSVLLMVLAAAMLLPAAADAITGNPDWHTFILSATAIFVPASIVFLATRGHSLALGLRQAFLLTGASWVALSASAALPFHFSYLDLSFTDAFFEAISGFTTTGSTVLTGLDVMAPGILLWRALLQWIGGVGIIVMSIAILPFLRVGGMQLFRMESSDRSDKVLPRPGQIALYIGIIYLGLTAACALLYYLTAMTGFDAVTHAMTTLSTGGYSTHDASFAFFGSAGAEWIATVFMAAGALPFVLYIRMLKGQGLALFRASQVRVFCLLILLASLLIAGWLETTTQVPPLDALRLAAFNVVSIVTTTGFASADYALWGHFAGLVFFCLTFAGGCTGSTAGSIKIFRFEILAHFVSLLMRQLYLPHVVLPQSYDGKQVHADVQIGVIAFFALYVACFGVLSLALGAIGLDFTTAISGAATSLGNVGPGLGNTIGPAGNFGTLPEAAKWLLALGMLLGRLELFTVFVLLMPGFWRV